MNDIAPWLDALHANPLDTSHRLVMADWCDENGYEWAAGPLRKGRMPLFTLDTQAIVALKNCNYAPATWDKKFASQLEPVEWSLTPRQYLWLWILLRKYRRSVRDAGIREEAEKRYEAYKSLHEAGMVKPSEPKPAKTRTGRGNQKAKASREVKSAEMPLFD